MTTSRKIGALLPGVGWREGEAKSGGDRTGPGPLGFSPTATPVQGGSCLPVHSQSSPIPFPSCSQSLPCTSVAHQESPDLCPALRRLLDSEGKGLGCHNGSSFPWFPGAPRLRLRINPELDDILVHWWP